MEKKRTLMKMQGPKNISVTFFQKTSRNYLQVAAYRRRTFRVSGKITDRIKIFM